MYSAIWAYPWDFQDEGYDLVSDRVAAAGLNGVSVASAYHNIRALCPHNPKRAVYHGEDGVLYFHPEPSHFIGHVIQPVLSDLCDKEDPLEQICKSAHKAGVKVHAWTVLHHNTRLGTTYPKCTVQNAFGDRYPFGLCPSNPDVRAYTIGLVRSLSERSEIDTIELESLGFMGMEHSGHHAKAGMELGPVHRFLLSLCLCDSCTSKMETHGVDVERARNAIVNELRAGFSGRFGGTAPDEMVAFEDILGADQAEGILAAREESVLSLLEEIYWSIKKPQTLSVMITGKPLTTGAPAWLTISSAREYTDTLLHQAFAKDTTDIHNAISDIAVRRGSTPLYAGIQAVSPFVNTGKELIDRVQTVREAGAEGVQFYHYGLMPLENLSWIKEALWQNA